MKSIRAKLTFYYALSATVTLACLFAFGYVLLENRLLHGLDLLNEAEFHELRAHLGPDYWQLDAREIGRRVRKTTQYASVLFYVNIHNRKTHDLFYSSNLNRQLIPDVPGKHIYNASMPGIGELRVEEFVLHGFDVTVGTPMSPLRNEMNTYVEVCIALLILMLVASIMIGMAFSRLMLRPIRAISDTANRIRHDNLSERIPVEDVHDEISDLARLLNQTFDRLEIAFDQTRRFAADASHELKTPLSLMRLHVEKLVVDGALSGDQEDVMVVILDEIGRLNRFIDELLFLSRAEANAIQLNFQCQDPELFLESFRQDAVVLTEHQGKQFCSEFSGSGRAAFEERWLRQVLLNLLSNALNVAPHGSRITLRSAWQDNIWRVSIEDEGPGLAAKDRARMFERFVRFNNAPDEGRGSGLGLAICRTVIALHKGRLYAEPGSAGKGLRLVFELPAYPSAGAGPAEEGDRAVPAAALP